MKNQLKTSGLLIFLLFFILTLTTPGLAQTESNEDIKDKLKTYKAANSSFAKGIKFFAKKKFNNAKKEFQKCLETFSAHSNASYHLAKISLSNKKTADALKYITEAKASFKEFNS